MRIESFKGLIEWTQASHAAMAQCLTRCAAENQDERAALVLTHLASHEAKMERMVGLYATRTFGEPEGDLEVALAADGPAQCNGRFATLSATEISSEVFAFHDKIINFYDDMIAKVKKRDVVEKMIEVRDMELKEAKLLVHQTGRMDDL